MHGHWGANNISSGNLSMTLGYNVNTNNKVVLFILEILTPCQKGQILRMLLTINFQHASMEGIILLQTIAAVMI